MTWANGIGPEGRPRELEGARPTPAGTKTCPAVRGATNWYSTAFNPATKLFYVMAVEDCNIYRQSARGGYVPSRDPANPPEKFLRAIDIETGKIAWEVPQVGAPEGNYSGVLSTAGGLVFYGETGGGFAAVDGKNGRYSVALRDGAGMAGLADDLFRKWKSIRRDRVRGQHSFVCSVRPVEGGTECQKTTRSLRASSFAELMPGTFFKSSSDLKLP